MRGNSINTSGTFDFELDFAGTLHCIPMSVRLKLDLCGIKLSLIETHTATAVAQFEPDPNPEWADVHAAPAKLSSFAHTLGVAPPSAQQWAALHAVQRFALAFLATACAWLCVGHAAWSADSGDVMIDDALVFPESLDIAADGTLYVGSWKGIVYRALPHQHAMPWIRPDAANGLLSILGVAVDKDRHRLWVCSVPAPTRDPPAPGISALLAFDLKTGALRLSLPFPEPASVCNDIAIAADDTAYVSDTPNGRIFKVRPHVDQLELFAEDEALQGVDGIVFSGSGDLYINLVTKGALFRVGIDKAGKFAGLTGITPSRTLAGPDGFRLIAGNRFLIAENKGGSIDQVTIEGNQASVATVRGQLMSPTSAVARKGVIYGVERKVQYLRDPAYQGKDPGTFQVLRITAP